jgi:pyruvate formate lyase activating enzyme
MTYGKIAAAHIDPVEKKPIFHLLPGSTAYSIAAAGCNLGCIFCQNWDIAQSRPEEVKAALVTPQQIVDAALKNGSKSIAYTYSEPVVFYEFVLNTAKLAKINGLRNIIVTSGFINPEPLKELAPYIDVFKIDLKGFNEKYYKQTCGAPLQPVLDTLILLRREGKFVEIVNLIVPGLNDGQKEIEKMCKWIYSNLGKDTPVFFSRFHPDYRLVNLPPTPLETLEEARRIAQSNGLQYVYLGNVPGSEGENTYCPNCHHLLIKRYGYAVLENNIVNGKCKYCGKIIPGIWE